MVANDAVNWETVLKMWEDFENAEFYEDDEYEMRLSKPFYHFPEGTTHMKIADWFDRQCPNGIIEDLLER